MHASQREGLRLTGILVTHRHPDRIGGVEGRQWKNEVQ